MNPRIKHMLLNRRNFFYALQKGLFPFLRGALWQISRLRSPKILFLGGNIKFINSTNIDFGDGVSIGANSYIETCSTERCRLADQVTLRENAWIQCRSGFNEPGVGLFIDRGAYLGPNAVIGVGGPIHIGEGCQIGAGLTLSAEEHAARHGDYTAGEVRRVGIRIGPRTWIGNNVTILDGVEIGEGCVIGAGAVVTKSIPPESMAVGIPAKVVRFLR